MVFDDGGVCDVTNDIKLVIIKMLRLHGSNFIT